MSLNSAPHLIRGHLLTSVTLSSQRWLCWSRPPSCPPWSSAPSPAAPDAGGCCRDGRARRPALARRMSARRVPHAPSAFCAVSRSGPIAEPPRPRTPTMTHTQRRVLPCSGHSWKIRVTFELLTILFKNVPVRLGVAISSKSRSRSSRSSSSSSSCREQPPRVQC